MGKTHDRRRTRVGTLGSGCVTGHARYPRGTPTSKVTVMSNAANTPGRRLYELAHLAELGVSMTDFQIDPEGCLMRIGQYDAIDLLIGGNRPLLPKQVALRTLWDAQWEAEGHCIVRHPHTRVVMSTA